jgi:S1-C subfamily serine protease
MKEAFMNITSKALSLVVVLFLMQGCATTIQVHFESDPPGAQIFAGPKPDQLKYYMHAPVTQSHRGVNPYWKEMYYQFKMEGYYDSEIIHEKQSPINTNRKVSATLKPIINQNTIYAEYESDPPGAQIFAGPKPDQLKFVTYTPSTYSHTGVNPYWKEEYYQFKKEGYYDSEIIRGIPLPVNTNRRVYATLKPIPTTIYLEFKSEPSGAQIFAGLKPDQMNFIGTTPSEISYSEVNPYWKEAYYQFKKAGYEDSEIIHEKQSPINTNRRVFATLKPVEKAVTISILIESSPSGAKIYAGPSPTDTKYIGTTPYTWSYTGINPYWPETYYVFSKEGYSSKVILAPKLPVNTNRDMWAYLPPIPETKISPTPEPKPEPKITSTPKPKDTHKPKLINTGTAFIINKQGNIVSNLHVVQECNSIEVRNASFKAKARLLATDSVNDLAVLTVDTIPSPSIGYFRSGKELRIGDDIITIGYPFGSILGESAKVTKGNISSLTGIANDSSMLQISAPVQPGSSGGPLLDNSGNIVGIVSSRLSELAMLKATGSLPQNVNFAIKSQAIQLFLATHKIKYSSQDSIKKYEAADIVERAEEFTLQVQCLE